MPAIAAATVSTSGSGVRDKAPPKRQNSRIPTPKVNTASATAVVAPASSIDADNLYSSTDEAMSPPSNLSDSMPVSPDDIVDRSLGRRNSNASSQVSRTPSASGVDRIYSPGKLRDFFSEAKRTRGHSQSGSDVTFLPQLYNQMVVASRKNSVNMGSREATELKGKMGEFNGSDSLDPLSPSSTPSMISKSKITVINGSSSSSAASARPKFAPSETIDSTHASPGSSPAQTVKRKSIFMSTPAAAMRVEEHSPDDLGSDIPVDVTTVKKSAAVPVSAPKSAVKKTASTAKASSAGAGDSARAKELSSAIQALNRPKSDTKIPKAAKPSNGAPPSSPTTSKTKAIKGAPSKGSPSSPTSSNGGKSKSEAKKPRPVTPDGMKRCEFCERAFAQDRFEKHAGVCLSRPDAKPRKIMSGAALRTQGTEFEEIAKKASKEPPKKPVKKTDWRKQHEEFIAAIRAAKG